MSALSLDLNSNQACALLEVLTLRRLLTKRARVPMPPTCTPASPLRRMRLFCTVADALSVTHTAMSMVSTIEHPTTFACDCQSPPASPCKCHKQYASDTYNLNESYAWQPRPETGETITSRLKRVRTEFDRPRTGLQCDQRAYTVSEKSLTVDKSTLSRCTNDLSYEHRGIKWKQGLLWASNSSNITETHNLKHASF